MRVTLMLCDYVAVAEGKLYVSGGGWTVTGPVPGPSGIAVLIGVPWDAANRTHALSLRLEHQDGEPVTQVNELGQDQPIEFFGDFEVGRPPGVLPGTTLDIPIAINMPPLPLTPGARYRWVLAIDGTTEPEWNLPFSTRATDAGA
ncbi:hypothetical protein V2J56_09315 [Georgenia sp. MJ206]|uniref:DUF6941 family protein n=1 Tax=Georgenia wangjunii TaxID=3117730 RepID=UPI002F267CA8